MALNDTGKEGMWLKGLLEELQLATVYTTEIQTGKKQHGADWLQLMGDNQGSLAIATRPVVNQLSRHIHRKWHWIRQNRKNGEFTLKYIPTKDMLADIMTKPLLGPRFSDLRSRIGIL